MVPLLTSKNSSGAINIVILFVTKKYYKKRLFKGCVGRKTCDKNNVPNKKL
jgi:hypothetical protein